MQWHVCAHVILSLYETDNNSDLSGNIPSELCNLENLNLKSTKTQIIECPSAQ